MLRVRATGAPGYPSFVRPRLATERSIALHAAVAEKLRRDPAVLARARARVRGWLEGGSVARVYAERWAELLERSVDDVASALVERSERMDDLRQTSPFAGTLAPRERWAILRRAGAP